MSFNISAQKKASVASKQEKYLVLSMQVSHHAYCNQWLNKMAQIFTLIHLSEHFTFNAFLHCNIFFRWPSSVEWSHFARTWARLCWKAKWLKSSKLWICSCFKTTGLPWFYLSFRWVLRNLGLMLRGPSFHIFQNWVKHNDT